MTPDRIWTPYCGAAPDPNAWLARWNLDPWLIAALVFVAAFLLCLFVSARLLLPRNPRPLSGFRDAWQLGGVVAVKPDGTVAYRYASKHPGDHPDPKDVKVPRATPKQT